MLAYCIRLHNAFSPMVIARGIHVYSHEHMNTHDFI